MDNKTIYSLWLQGYDQAPDQVKTCIDRWNGLNPTYNFELLDEAAAQKLLSTKPDLKLKNASRQALSDIIRVALLQEHGGIWVDATVFPTKPLDDWFPDLVGDSEFFSYKREKRQSRPKNRPISAWFLYSKSRGTIIDKLWTETEKYWSVDHRKITDQELKVYYEDPIDFMGLHNSKPNTPYPYHWFQHIFYYLSKTDQEFALAWDESPYRSMSIPHQTQYWLREEIAENRVGEYLNDEIVELIVTNSEVQKLNWRLDFPMDLMIKYSSKIPDNL